MSIFDDLFDKLGNSVGNTVEGQIGRGVTGASGNLINELFAALGLGNNVVGNTSGGWGTSPGAAAAKDLIDLYGNYPLQQIKYNKPGVSTYSASTMAGASPITASTIGQLDPVEAFLLQNPQLVADSPEMRDQLVNVLGRYDTVANEGMTDADRGQLNLITAQQAANSANSDNAVLNDLQNRGQLGSLEEILTRQAGRGNAARNANQQGITLQQQAEARRRQANTDLANLASNVRASDINLNAKNADITNSANQFNATSQNQIALANATRELQAMLADQAARNNTAMFNTTNDLNTQKFNASQAQNAAQDNARMSNNMNLQNAENEMRALQYDNQNDLTRLAGMGAAYKLYGDQLNAEEAARARQQFGNAVMGGNFPGGVNYGTGSNPYAWNYGNNSSNPYSPGYNPYGNGSGSNGSSGGMFDDIWGGIGDLFDWGTGDGNTYDPYSNTWSWDSGNASTGNLPPSSWDWVGNDIGGYTGGSYGDDSGGSWFGDIADGVGDFFGGLFDW